jgi:hypothetical protein
LLVFILHFNVITVENKGQLEGKEFKDSKEIKVHLGLMVQKEKEEMMEHLDLRV